MEFTYALRFRFDAANNEAKYEALIAELRIAEQMAVKNLQGNVDSRLVANQVNGTYVAKEVDMIRYLEKKVLVEELKEKSIGELEILAVVEEEGDTWMTSIFEYLTEETLPADVKKTRAVRRKSQRFAIINGTLYKKSFLGPWLRNPQQKLTQITSPWPFYKWGIDIAGPFPEGPGKVKFIIVNVDYFTKFRLPGEIISNNGKQFQAIHSKTGEGIKARLDARNKNWMEELSHVLWAHRIMIKSSNKDTPFSLTYGTEAVILAKIGMPTLRTTEVDLVQNNEALEINLDLLEERRESKQQYVRQRVKQKMEKYYNSKV
ncbi:reverse transcriptase domain-containing protein [Tanacetum coccineum]